jgi:hypothetical protein
VYNTFRIEFLSAGGWWIKHWQLIGVPDKIAIHSVLKNLRIIKFIITTVLQKTAIATNRWRIYIRHLFVVNNISCLINASHLILDLHSNTIYWKSRENSSKVHMYRLWYPYKLFH